MRASSSVFKAASRDDTEGVEKLIRQGADVNSTQFGAETPLHIASLRGSTKVVQILLSYGARADP